MKKVLIVDDIKENRYFYNRLFREKGYRTQTCANGKEALKILKTRRFDLIVSDVLMPEMDGFELCKMCKIDERLKNVPFIFLSLTSTDKKDEMCAQEVGAQGIIGKPYDLDNFVECIEKFSKDCNCMESKLKNESLDQITELDYLREYRQRITKKFELMVPEFNYQVQHLEKKC